MMNADPDPRPSRLLTPGDEAPLIVANPGGSAAILLVCDHAGRAVPRRLGRLGLGDEAFERHIAWDIGAGGLCWKLSAALDAAAARQAYSRLVIDCNRAPGREDLVPQVSDGTAVPANQGLDTAAVQARIDEIHVPYHAGIADLLDRRMDTAAPLVVSVHSFTPTMGGVDRPWHVGVLHAHDSKASTRMLELLGAQAGLVVGDNQPYAMDGVDYTVPRHAQARGLDYLELEIRQDLISGEPGQAKMAALLAPLIARCGG